MADVQTDLLSFADVAFETDALFREFLDTSLMRYSYDNKDARDKYWTDVLGFRAEQLAPASKDRDEYRYWFDVRADYWSPDPKKNQALEELIGTLRPGKRLELLAADARALEARINALGVGEGTALPRVGQKYLYGVGVHGAPEGLPSESDATVRDPIERSLRARFGSLLTTLAAVRGDGPRTASEEVKRPVV